MRSALFSRWNIIFLKIRFLIKLGRLVIVPSVYLSIYLSIISSSPRAARSIVLVVGITGDVNIDENGDRIADYSLLDMNPETSKFEVN